MQSYEDYQKEDAELRSKSRPIVDLFHQLEGASPCRTIRFTGSSWTHAEALVECDGQKIFVTARLLP